MDEDEEKEFGPQQSGLDPQQKEDLYAAMMDRENSSVADARSASDKQGKMAMFGQALEGMTRAESQAIGGQGVDSNFWNKLGANKKGDVREAQMARRAAVKKYLSDKKDSRDSEQQGYDRGRDTIKDQQKKDRLDSNERIRKAADEESLRRFNISTGMDRQRLTARQDQVKISNELKQQALEDKLEKKSPNELKKEGLAVIGEQAEDQYRKSIDRGMKSGDYDPTSSLEMVDSSSWAPNWMKSDAAIESKANAASWIDSYLRDESGAAIPTDERASYFEIYFPQPGDTEQAVKDKALLRKTKMGNARTASRTTAPKKESGVFPGRNDGPKPGWAK